MDYLIHMGFLLALPAYLSWYIVNECPKESPARLVWILFAYLAWMLHTGYGNKVDKWEACGQLEAYTGWDNLPQVCWESDPDLVSD